VNVCYCTDESLIAHVREGDTTAPSNAGDLEFRLDVNSPRCEARSSLRLNSGPKDTTEGVEKR
jgi:hypothetical protein